jgi:hypothetical protein
VADAPYFNVGRAITESSRVTAGSSTIPTHITWYRQKGFTPRPKSVRVLKFIIIEETLFSVPVELLDKIL